jgi:asparagine synthase (glutamine-hydrolysing)
MCGFSGIVDFSGRATRMERDLGRMHASIAHRGINGEGFVVADETMRAQHGEMLSPLLVAGGTPRAGLGFRWLIIQDPDRLAGQPMRSPDGSVWIVFNGEIYNFIELRQELEREGFHFQTHVDTEVILAAYQRWGFRCFDRFNGMWAMLLLDLKRRTLIGCRDRFGIKPFFYKVEADRILFASEIKAIIAGGGQPDVHRPALYAYLHGKRVDMTEETYYRDIFTVPAATRFEVPLDGPHPGALRFEPWWSLDGVRSAPRPRIDYIEGQRELEARLQRAIQLNMRAHVKVGSFISGGLDSSLITSMMRSNNGSGNHDTFSVVFDRERWARFDESQYVDDFIRQSGATNYRVTFDPAWIKENIRALTWTQEEPLMASTLFAQSRAFALAHEQGTRVVLDGLGSDEILGGYPRHEFAVWRDRLAAGRLAPFLRESRVLSRRDGVSMPALFYQNLLRPAGGAVVRRFGLPYRRYDWIEEGYFAHERRAFAEQRRTRNREIAGWPTRLDREIVRDLRFHGLRPLLLYGDRAGMAHSIEARLPFLDHELVEFSLQLPDDFKAGFGQRKRILRDVARKYLPSSIVDRVDKMGFVTPEPVWLRESFSDELNDVADRAGTVPFLRAPQVKRFLSDFAAGRHNDFRAVWRLYALRHWMEVFPSS